MVRFFANVIGIYLLIGVALWAVQTGSDIYARTSGKGATCSGGDIPDVHQVLGVDASGFKQIAAWGPSLVQSLRQGIPLGAFVLPQSCAPAGSIAFHSTRCICRAPLTVDGRVMQFMTLHYWVRPGETCAATKPRSCTGQAAAPQPNTSQTKMSAPHAAPPAK
jgi:hypothetical protein